MSKGTTDSPRVCLVDRDLWVVYKPSGMAVHPAGPRTPPDLLGWLTRHGASRRIAPAHRLDVGTSGLVLLTPDRTLRSQLGGWFADGQVEKHYEALVIGRTRPKGTVNRPLPDARRGRPLRARTRYRRLEWLGGFTHLRVQPETGRKHQIRRHLQQIGHPIVGDTRYRPRRKVRVPGFPDRLWLHAAYLELPDGRTFSCPLPPLLLSHLELLREGAKNRPAREE